MILIGPYRIEIFGQITKNTILVLVFAICLVSESHGNATASPLSCKQRTERFLHDPVGASVEALGARPDEDCWLALMRSEDSLQSLIAAVAKGSIPAARYLAPHIRELDGGDLEDADVALGLFSMYDMQEFMHLALSGVITEDEFKSALVMLPLTLSDMPEAQLAELRKRRENIERISDPALGKYRGLGVAAIDSSIEETKRAMSAPQR